ncbi:MAG: hypothetical protein ACOCZM_00560 [Bacillota bacterium]
MGIIFILLGIVLISFSLYLKYLQPPGDVEDVSSRNKGDIYIPEGAGSESRTSREPGSTTQPRLEEKIEELAERFREMAAEVHSSREQFEERLDKLLAEIEREEEVPRFRDYLEDRLEAVSAASEVAKNENIEEDGKEESVDEEQDTEKEDIREQENESSEIAADEYEEIFSSYREGKDPEEIAEMMGMGIRETRLILKFHREGGD